MTSVHRHSTKYIYAGTTNLIILLISTRTVSTDGRTYRLDYSLSDTWLLVIADDTHGARLVRDYHGILNA